MLHLQVYSISLIKGFSQTMILTHKTFLICLKTGIYIAKTDLRLLILFPLPLEYLGCFQLYDVLVKNPSLVKAGSSA